MPSDDLDLSRRCFDHWNNNRLFQKLALSIENDFSADNVRDMLTIFPKQQENARN